MLIEIDIDIAWICFEAISTFYRRFKEYTSIYSNKYRM